MGRRAGSLRPRPHSLGNAGEPASMASRLLRHSGRCTTAQGRETSGRLRGATAIQRIPVQAHVSGAGAASVGTHQSDSEGGRVADCATVQRLRAPPTPARRGSRLAGRTAQLCGTVDLCPVKHLRVADAGGTWSCAATGTSKHMLEQGHENTHEFTHAVHEPLMP